MEKEVLDFLDRNITATEPSDTTTPKVVFVCKRKGGKVGGLCVSCAVASDAEISDIERRGLVPCDRCGE